MAFVRCAYALAAVLLLAGPAAPGDILLAGPSSEPAPGGSGRLEAAGGAILEGAPGVFAGEDTEAAGFRSSLERFRAGMRVIEEQLTEDSVRSGIEALCEGLERIEEPSAPLCSSRSVAAPAAAGRLADLVDELEAVRDAQIDIGLPIAPYFGAQNDAERAEVETEAEVAAPPSGEAEAPLEQVERPQAPAITPARILSPPAEIPGGAPPVMMSGGTGDPLSRRVSLEFHDEELSLVVNILAAAGQVNVIAEPDLKGTVNANLRDVPLRKAFDIVLESKGLGIIEEAGVFRIVLLEDALAANRVQNIITLVNTKAVDLKKTLDGVITGAKYSELVSITPDPTTNVLVIAGPPKLVADLEALARQLDVATPKLPTVTEAIRLNYLSPDVAIEAVQSILHQQAEDQRAAGAGAGTASVTRSVVADETTRHLIVTAVPAVVEQARALIEKIDIPVKQVAIQSMVVDITLDDDAATGVQWLIDNVNQRDPNGIIVGPLSGRNNMRGVPTGNVDDLNAVGNLGGSRQSALALNLGILSADFDIQALISAEVQNNNAKIITNPTLITTENNPATMNIGQKIPFRQINETEEGGRLSGFEFVDVGSILEVTPTVTHSHDILVDIKAEQSFVSGFTPAPDNQPIIDTRQAHTNLRTSSGKTIFIAGLRRADDTLSIRKIPFLGDIPGLNFVFRSTRTNKSNVELMIFLTCYLFDEELPPLTGKEQSYYEILLNVPETPQGERDMWRSMMRPGEVRDPFWKWRRPSE